MSGPYPLTLTPDRDFLLSWSLPTPTTPILQPPYCESEDIVIPFSD